MNPEKDILRAQFKKLRAELPEAERQRRSRLIADLVSEFVTQRPELKHYHLFFPIAKQQEIDTFWIKEFLEQHGLEIYTSRLKPNSNEMDTLKLKSGTGFYLGDWGIPVPDQFEISNSSQVEVIFVPLLVVDQKGNRIGFGKGFYDVYMQKLDAEVLKVGLSFFEPIANIPREPHDIQLDYCITPEKCITF